MAKTNKTSSNVVELKRKNSFFALDMDFMLLFSTLVILAIGFVMVFTTSSAANMGAEDIYKDVKTQALYAVLGVVIMFCIAKIDYKKYKKFSTLAYIITLVVMLMVGLVGIASHGATRQISFGPVSIQPSEFSKFVLILWLASRFSSMSNKTFNSWKEYLITMGGVGIIAFECVYLQNHASAGLIHLFVALALIVAAGVDWTKFIPTCALGGVALYYLIFAKDFRQGRVDIFLNPDADSQGMGYQIKQSLYAVGSGGLFGKGFGNSVQKYSYLPEAENDYIFAIFCEEYGFIGSMLLVGLFLVLVWRGLSIALNCKDSYGTYIAFGISVLIGFQVYMNMSVVLNVMIPTGVQLPLFSSGGSSTISMLMGIGVLLSISRQNMKNSRGVS